MSAAQVAVFGESLVDITRTAGASRAWPGGSPMNVALGMARLGVEVEFATSIGQDTYGDLIRTHLAASGVQLTAGSVDDSATSVAEATIGVDGSATYRFEMTWNPNAEPLGRPAIAHFGSISAVLEPGADKVLNWITDLPPSTIVSFDPNVRPSITGSGPQLRAAIDRAAGNADIIKMSSEDLELLDDPHLVSRWLQGRTKVVLVTDGDKGAQLITLDREIRLPAPRVRVADTIGAGDSFMAALLSSLSSADVHSRDQLEAASVDDLASHAEFAIRCAAITVSREGANPPTLAEVAG